MSLRVMVIYEPGGDPGRASVLRDVRISNTRRTLPEISDYRVEEVGKSDVSLVRRHHRSKGLMPLIRKALEYVD